MELWGLTGGIACGKSTVSRLLAARGATIIDADLLARQVVEPGTPALASLVEAFGPAILLPNGQLDRKALGTRVFSDPAARATLNGITHPAIARAAMEATAATAAAGAPVAVYDAALLVENGLHHGMAQVMVVAASTETQVRRLRERDGLSEADARARIASQLPLEDKRRVATVVFENDGTPAELEAQVDAFWRRARPAATP